MRCKKKNYPKNEENTKCPVCEKEEDTTEHVLECEAEYEKGKYNIELVTKISGSK